MVIPDDSQHEAKSPNCQDCGSKPTAEYAYTVRGDRLMAHLCWRCARRRVLSTLAEDLSERPTFTPGYHPDQGS